MIVGIAIFMLVAALTASTYVIYRLSKRLLIFDELFEIVQQDVNTNIEYFDKLLETPLFTNSQEVQNLNRNIAIMKVRYEEVLKRSGEATNRDFSRKQKKNANPPVVR